MEIVKAKKIAGITLNGKSVDIRRLINSGENLLSSSVWIGIWIIIDGINIIRFL